MKRGSSAGRTAYAGPAGLLTPAFVGRIGRPAPPSERSSLAEGADVEDRIRRGAVRWHHEPSSACRSRFDDGSAICVVGNRQNSGSSSTPSTDGTWIRVDSRIIRATWPSSAGGGTDSEERPRWGGAGGFGGAGWIGDVGRRLGSGGPPRATRGDWTRAVIRPWRA